MNIDGDDIVEIVYGDHPDYEVVADEHPTETSRWHTYYEMIVKHNPTELFYRINWSQGSTEYQDEGPEDITMIEVKPVQKTITAYEAV